MPAPPKHSPEARGLRPLPSHLLRANAILWIILLIAGALALPIANWNTPQGGALETIPLCLFLILSACGMYHGVFRFSLRALEWLAGILLVAGLFAMVAMPVGLYQAMVAGSMQKGRVVVAISLIVHSFVTAAQLSRWSDVIKTYLTFRPNCNHCAYNLTGSIHANQNLCPECGRPIPLEKIAKLRANSSEETRT
ncbi:MAG: hypothetical protein WD768_14865 [Phycisphaeraceae bacterium]